MTALPIWPSSCASSTWVAILLNQPAASLMTLAAPPATASGTPFNVTVTAHTSAGAVATGYRGTVRFTSTDPAATLPANYTFTAADSGTHTFTVTLATSGRRILTVADTAGGPLTASAAVTVDPQPLKVIAFGPDAGMAPRVIVFEVGRVGPLPLRYDFLAFPSIYTAGVRLAVVDVTGDGMPDIIAGTGPGVPAQLRVFDGASAGPSPAQVLGPLGSFLPYGSTYSGGVFVAAGDVTGDGRAEVVVSPDAGFFPGFSVAPPLLGFDGATGTLLAFAWVYEPTFTGGVRIAMADVSGDGMADLVTVPGPGRPVEVKVFSAAGVNSFLAFSAGYTGGAYVAAADVNGDGRADIAVGSGPGQGGLVRLFDSSATGPAPNPLRQLFPLVAYSGAVRVALVDVNGDGRVDLTAGSGPGSPSLARTIDALSGILVREGLVYDLLFLGGFFVAG